MAKNYTQESNSTGLALAREVSLGVLPALPALPVFSQRAPNSYKDFGPSYKSKARSPINASRQEQKGVVVDRDAAAGWQEDLTYAAFGYMAEAVFYANYRRKGDVFVAAVTAADGYHPANGAGGQFFRNGDIIAGVGFGNVANNGAKVLTADGSAADVGAAGTADEPNATGYISKVGHVFAAGDISLSEVGNVFQLNSAAGVLNNLGVIPGETVYIGDDNPANAFATPAGGVAPGGFCRIASVSADGKSAVIDKIQNPGTDAGAGKTIAIYVGRVLKNESDPNLIERISFTMERTLGKGDDTDPFQQAEYVHGTLVDSFDMPLNTADKITTDYTMVGTKYSTVTSTVGPIQATRPVLADGDAFTTSNDMVHQSLNICGNATALYAFLTDVSISIKNNIKPNKALGILGAFDLTAGNFQVSASCNAYFADVTAQEAIAQNDNVTFGFALVRSGQGIVIDLPLVSLGDGKPKVASNEPITVALTMQAARASLLSPATDYTAMVVFYDYLPVVAHGPAQ